MISRKTPLKRSTKPLKRTRLRKVSPGKMQARRHYSKRAKAYKETHPECAVKIAPDCTGITQDIHHTFPQGQYPSLFLVESLWLATCRRCHDYLHSHPSESRSKNLLK